MLTNVTINYKLYYTYGRKNKMNILAIGNGFDLAHGLNTSYVDFLQTIDIFSRKIDVTNGPDSFLDKFKGTKIENAIREYIFLKLSDELKDEKLNSLVSVKAKNFWIMYFTSLLEDRKKPRNNWIDFELQIKNVIIQVENAINNNNLIIKMNRVEGIDSQISNYLYIRKKEYNNYKEIIEVLENDLDELIYCLEIYLEKFINDTVKNGLIEVYSPDIKNTNFDKVLSFNYTKTFELLYGKKGNIEYHYIHGKADINHTVNTSNIVMGVEEYLSEDKKDRNLDFVSFKKFYQRIYKETGSTYKRWLAYDEIGENKFGEFSHHLYIFGHSLDITDGDILRDLILNDKVFTTIYYRNKNAMKKQIVNLIKVIGEDELIKRTSEMTKTIEFRQQQEMKRIKN